MNTNNIEDEVPPTPRLYIPASKLPDTVRKAYELSNPQGMGFLHHQPGPLPEQDVRDLVAHGNGRAIRLDYVKGRSVKLTILYDHEKGEHFTWDTGRWYDHSERDWAELKAVIEG